MAYKAIGNKVAIREDKSEKSIKGILIPGSAANLKQGEIVEAKDKSLIGRLAYYYGEGAVKIGDLDVINANDLFGYDDGEA